LQHEALLWCAAAGRKILATVPAGKKASKKK
jgi:hypothetical protein